MRSAGGPGAWRRESATCPAWRRNYFADSKLRSGHRFKPAAALLFDVLVQAAAVGIHRDDAGEVANPQVPQRLRHPELGERHALDLLHAPCVELRRAADGAQVDGARALEGLERPGTHAALAND